MIYGIYKGIVTNDADPEGLYRIKAIVPVVFGNTTTETNWALPCFPPGFENSASALVKAHPAQTLTASDEATVDVPALAHVLNYAVPKAGAGVWIAFEGGDVDYPVWLGVWQASA